MTGLRATGDAAARREARSGGTVYLERATDLQRSGRAVARRSGTRIRTDFAEIAVNQGRADRDLGLLIGTPAGIVS